jgi:HK97 gp10 family phage protein
MMAEIITFRMDGLQELGQRMRKLSDKVAKQAAGRATGRAAAIVKKAAKNKLKQRIDTGLLEKNVISKRIAKSKTQLTSEHIVTVKKEIYRRGGERIATRKVGALVEFGTVKVPSVPFLRTGLLDNVEKCKDAMKKTLDKAITKGGA